LINDLKKNNKNMEECFKKEKNLMFVNILKLALQKKEINRSDAKSLIEYLKEEIEKTNKKNKKLKFLSLNKPKKEKIDTKSNSLNVIKSNQNLRKNSQSSSYGDLGVLKKEKNSMTSIFKTFSLFKKKN
jgi:adenylosuccinate lyase